MTPLPAFSCLQVADNTYTWYYVLVDNTYTYNTYTWYYSTTDAGKYSVVLCKTQPSTQLKVMDSAELYSKYLS